MSKIPPEAFAGAKEIDFTEELENWNEYKLEDGTFLKIKLVLRGVKRLAKYKPDGSPIYIINSINIVRTLDVPEELMEKIKASEVSPI